MQAGISGQILVDNGAEVLVVSQMLSEDHECNGNISGKDGDDVAHINFLDTLHCFQESELGNCEDAHILEQGKIDNRNAADGEDGGHSVARQDTNDEGDQFHHLLAIDRDKDNHKQSYHCANEGDPDVSAHCEIRGDAEGGLCTVGENIVNGSTGQAQTDQCHGGSNNNGGHQLVDPLNANKLDYQSDDHIHQTGKNSTDDQTGKTGRSGNCTAKGSSHGADESEGRAQENGAAELGEQLVNDGADAGAEESGSSGHAVANDGGNSDGGCQNGQNLLECEDQQLGELGSVFDAIDQIHA